MKSAYRLRGAELRHLKGLMAVYAIVNKVNGKKYVGSTKDVRERWYNHKTYLNRNKHANTPLQSDWNEYGEESFQIKVLEIIRNKEDLFPSEQKWMDELNPEYNILKFAGSVKGAPTSEKKRAATRLSNSSRTPEQRERMAMLCARRYELISPNGERTVIVNLKKYCRENSLDISAMIKVSKGKKIQYKGWTPAI